MKIQNAIRTAQGGGKYLLAAAFAIAGITKVISPEQFLSFLAAIPLFDALNHSLALYLVLVIEFAIVILLILPRTLKLGALFSFGTLFVFTALLMIVSQSDVNVTCGCFGGYVGDNSLDTSVLRNVILLVLSCFVGQEVSARMVEP